MAFDVVYGREGLLLGESQGLCICEANKKRSNETWPRRRRDPVDLFKLYSCVGKSLIDDRPDFQQMFTGSKLGNDPAVRPVGFDLRIDDVRKNVPSIPHYCRGCLITGCFDAEN